jgi:hypothetical protein
MRSGVIVSDLDDPRVLFAAERTLLAWNRSNLSPIALLQPGHAPRVETSDGMKHEEARRGDPNCPAG